MMPFEMTKNDFFFTMAGLLLLLGVVCFLSGLIILISRVLGSDVQRLAAQTAKMVQKGISEEIAGLVGNAATLIESLNQLVHTTAGIGVFLMLVGMLLILASYFLVVRIV
ncbi:hypothetical protein [uncultured Thermanaerothrix sp.]|uniref:hypothetical protein n=1 Tax=uncultured Thermanaerothrix sp. TaxID=1195149 RepID=UPI00260AF355|nr:hypothetical protein [uncultured Thermanaerothrix sp.]